MAAKVIKQGFIKAEGFGCEKLNELTFLCGKKGASVSEIVFFVFFTKFNCNLSTNPFAPLVPFKNLALATALAIPQRRKTSL